MIGNVVNTGKGVTPYFRLVHRSSGTRRTFGVREQDRSLIASRLKNRNYITFTP